MHSQTKAAREEQFLADKVSTREQLVSELIDLITDAVNLRHIDKSQLNEDTLLAHAPGNGIASGQSLGLDSIDIFEAVVVVEQRYGFKIEDAARGEQVFKTFGSIADHILSK